MIRHLALCFLLTACATTGDPSRGGLFGWSEDKARARQETLLREIDAAHAATQKEAAEYDYLKSTKGDLAERLAALDELYSALLAENDALRDQVKSLVAEEATAADHLATLRSDLVSPGSGAAQTFAELDSEAEKERHVAQLQQQNQQLRTALGL